MSFARKGGKDLIPKHSRWTADWIEDVGRVEEACWLIEDVFCMPKSELEEYFLRVRILWMVASIELGQS